MAVIRLTCPWCGLEKSAFQMRLIQILDAPNKTKREALASCGGCGRFVLAEIHNVTGTASGIDWNTWAGEIPNDWLVRVDTHPAPKNADAPKHTPDKAANSFSQAMRALLRSDWDAAGMMARKSLEQATGEIDKTFTRSDGLKARIDKLAKAQLVTPQLANWAHAIRDIGNDAAHDDFTEPEAREICEFAETFLEYVFTMPAKLAARKAHRGKP